MTPGDVRGADCGKPEFRDADFPAEPYPGARPDHSFVHEDGVGFRLSSSFGGWQVGGRGLSDWMAGRGAEPLETRVPVLAYGSNACPSKITWLRGAHGLAGPVVVLRAEVVGVTAVWAAGLRIVDDQRPATLAADPAARETHAVWLATPDQIHALDRCEGRSDRYERITLPTGEVTLEDGSRVEDTLAYVGHRPDRMPLLVDGRPVRCVDVAQDQAKHLVGVPAREDGLRRRARDPDGPAP